ncbi:unnamed protein product [Amoebophrya sp. A25]|nr:unnamed protein product [Amoebophrya sp. A25]|eukprot:GSA25T00004681001.1
MKSSTFFSPSLLLWAFLVPVALIPIGISVFIRLPELICLLHDIPSLLGVAVGGEHHTIMQDRSGLSLGASLTFCRLGLLATASLILGLFVSTSTLTSLSFGETSSSRMFFFLLITSGIFSSLVLFLGNWALDDPMETELRQRYAHTSRLAGKSVLITGANSGLGLETAVWAAGWGLADNVILGTRSQKKCLDARDTIMGRIEKDKSVTRSRKDLEQVLHCSFSFELGMGIASKEKIEAEVEKVFGDSSGGTPKMKLDFLVANAGFSGTGGGRPQSVGTALLGDSTSPIMVKPEAAMFVAHKVLQRALERKFLDLETVTVSSATGWLACTPWIRRIVETSWNPFLTHASREKLDMAHVAVLGTSAGSPSSGGSASGPSGAAGSLENGGALIPQMCSPEPVPSIQLLLQDETNEDKEKLVTSEKNKEGISAIFSDVLQLASNPAALADVVAGYARVKYWQMAGVGLGSGDSREVSVVLGFVRTSIWRAAMEESPVGLFMRRGSIGAIPIVAALVGDRNEKYPNNQRLPCVSHNGAFMGCFDSIYWTLGTSAEALGRHVGEYRQVLQKTLETLEDL